MDRRLQEEDTDFYEAQREHFSPEAEEERRLKGEEEREKREQVRLEQSDDEVKFLNLYIIDTIIPHGNYFG